MNDDDGVITGLVDPVVEIILVDGTTVVVRKVDHLALVRDLLSNGFVRIRTAEHDSMTIFEHGVSAVRGRPEAVGD